jgi:hypothetical protein
MLFRMTQDDIDLATRSDTRNCPIARCFARTLIEQRRALSYNLRATELAQEVRDFAAAFDRGEVVLPIEFEAELFHDTDLTLWDRRS